jgi:predicted nucleic acid-binding protein
VKKKRIVVDTTAIISYFSSIFGEQSQISPEGLSIIQDAFESDDRIIMIIPSIVFVEIFDKWFKGTQQKDEEFRAKFLAEVLHTIQRSPNMEVREIDDEVIEKFLELYDEDIGLEQRDRIILASAVVLNAYLITSDKKIILFQKRYSLIPEIIT